MQSDFKEREVWLEMEALKQTNKQTNCKTFYSKGAQKCELL